MSKTYGNYINGQWVAAGNKRTFAVRNPAHAGEVVGECAASGGEDVKRAVEAAAGAFEGWAGMSAIKRGGLLRKAGEVLGRRREEAAKLLCREEGKPIFEACGEVDRSIALLEYYAAQGAMLGGETVGSGVEGRFLYTMRVPLGVVGLITPWNFPSAIPVWKLAPALVCGNTVVLKPASLAPLSAMVVAECLAEAGLPAGVFSVVTGGGKEVGDALVGDERVKAISFTGSCEIGRGIIRKGAERLIRVGLEMGGKNPHVVLEDADLDRAVNDVMVGAFWGSGHKCTACSRAIVVEAVHDAFVEKLIRKTGEIRVGEPLAAQTQVGPVIDERQLESILHYVDIGCSGGAKLMVGGKRLRGGVYDEGWYMSPAVFVGVERGMRIAREEIFGPVVGVIRVKDFEEAVRVANDVEYGLSAGISTRSIGRSLEFARRVEAGVVHVNNPTAGLELQVPFGGCKCSSSGWREMGRTAIEFYTQVRTVYVEG